MSAFNTLLAVCLGVVDLVAVVAAFAVRDESAARLRAWARTFALSAFGLIVLTIIRFVVIVVGATVGGAMALDAEPSGRASGVAHGVSEGLNGVALAIVGAVLPLFVALVFGLRASRRASTEP